MSRFRVLSSLLRHGISGISIESLGWQYSLKKSYILCHQNLNIFQFHLNLSVTALLSTLLLLSGGVCVLLPRISSTIHPERLTGNQTCTLVFLQQLLFLKCPALQIPTSTAAQSLTIASSAQGELSCFSWIQACT